MERAHYEQFKKNLIAFAQARAMIDMVLKAMIGSMSTS